jgi:hypothetical protein
MRRSVSETACHPYATRPLRARCRAWHRRSSWRPSRPTGSRTEWKTNPTPVRRWGGRNVSRASKDCLARSGGWMRTQVPPLAAFLWAAAASAQMHETSTTNSVSCRNEPDQQRGTAKYALRTKHNTAQHPGIETNNLVVRALWTAGPQG